MPRNLPLVLRIAAIWVFYASWASATGWVLSYFHQLHAVGYAVAAVPTVMLAAWWWIRSSPSRPRFRSQHVVRRLRSEPSFACWVIVALLILLGGVLNPPSNYDGLTYRLPRLLYWLQEHHWFWINGIDFRLDIAGAGYEWMSAPVLLLTGSDRCLFLLNFIPFLLLPGLFFVAASGLGIRPRHARWWMWVWPMAYGVATQAASIGNDLAGAAFGIISLAFAAEAGRGRPAFCLGVSALAAALMTGIKVTTLPLGLPIAVFWCWQAWRYLGIKRLVLAVSIVAPAAVLCSFLPMAYLCWRETGAWNANPGNRLCIETEHPVAGIVGNGLNITLGALYPPLFPGVGQINGELTHALEQKNWFLWVKSKYPAFDLALNHEFPTEEGAGIGLGLTILAGAWWMCSFRHRDKFSRRPATLGKLFVWGTLLALLVFIAKLGGNSAPRLLIPFTPFLVLAFLLNIPGLLRIPSVRWSVIPALFLLPSLLLNPNRPLIPLARIASLPFVPSGMQKRITDVYGSYSTRNNLLAPLRDRIPQGDVIAYGGGGDQSAFSLFKPFGHRKVYDLSPSRESLAVWVVGTKAGIERRMGVPLEEWEKDRYQPTFEQKIVSKVTFGPETWYVFHRVK